MSWQQEIDELRAREALAEQMGGAEAVARQTGQGKLTVRARVDALLDPGTLHEIGKIAGSATYQPDGTLDSFRASNFVVGHGRIAGRPVVVQADDFTVRGGAADAAIWQKIVLAEKLAGEYRLPLIRLVDGTGGGGSSGGSGGGRNLINGICGVRRGKRRGLGQQVPAGHGGGSAHDATCGQGV
jgi:propionyl-CoA carboxylase beta chain